MVESGKAFLKVKLADWAESWLLNYRQNHRGASRPLTDQETLDLRGYFRVELLAQVRVATVERLTNPPFFGSLFDLGVPVPWDFSADTGLSAVDTIVLSEPLIQKGRWPSVLFHQCVHVQQFQTLGVSRLISRYVHGLFENGFNFRALPMERQADDLRFRFDAGLKMFSVEREVEQALIGGAI